MYYHFKVHKEQKGLWAECLELPGCDTEAIDLHELKKNMREVLSLYLTEPEDSSLIQPLPGIYQLTDNIIRVEVEPEVALSFLLRRYRLMHKLTQSMVSEKLGFNNLWSYQRLERPTTANPTLTTLKKLKEAYPDLPLDLIF